MKDCEYINLHPLRNGTYAEMKNHYKLISEVLETWKAEIKALSPDFKGTIDKVVDAVQQQMRCGCCSNEKEHIENTKYLISEFKKTLLKYEYIFVKLWGWEVLTYETREKYRVFYYDWSPGDHHDPPFALPVEAASVTLSDVVTS